MKALLAAATLVGAGLAGLPAAAVPVIDIPSAQAVFVAQGGAGDLLFEGDAIAEGAGPLGNLRAIFALSFDLASPYDTARATLDLSDGNGLVLGGLAFSIGRGEDLLALTFDDLDGPAASIFGTALTFELFFLDPVGEDPLGGLVDGTTYDLAALGVGQDVPAPIPLPGSGVLLLAALAMATGVGVGRRSRAA
ncbi:hypothetical protein [Rubellimicrobium roseum]|uniref:VPLPA-CTERM sorting domain-containing protein n=1 Tax=Rubellimicrobium roseum TaxID=687525 RepID=A0A5C4NFX4_9RHOB|nr:hypothetical protein [Rubellimicrobium roseum]TNC73681.1 hypothetical protein FHG71_04130 [Rubellimicrobium roseum]